MVMHKVFGVERNIDIPADVFPKDKELEASESAMPGCEHGWFDSVYESAKLHYRKWLPRDGSKPKAILIYMHGILTHGGKAFVLEDDQRKINMALVADECAKQGFALYAHDMYGHGYSEGTRWLIPYSWQNHLKDLVNFCNLVASMHDNSIPLFLMGESYGGTLSIFAAKQFQEDPSSGPKNFDSIILIGPAIIGDLPPYPVVFVLRYMLAPFFPAWRPSFMPNMLGADRIWRDPKVLAVEFGRPQQTMIDGSGLAYRLGTAVNLLNAVETVRKQALVGFKTPFCILHGTDDFGVPIKGSEYMWEKADKKESESRFLRKQGAYHDLFADPLAEECMKDVCDWIHFRIDSKL